MLQLQGHNTCLTMFFYDCGNFVFNMMNPLKYSQLYSSNVLNKIVLILLSISVFISSAAICSLTWETLAHCLNVCLFIFCLIFWGRQCMEICKLDKSMLVIQSSIYFNDFVRKGLVSLVVHALHKTIQKHTGWPSKM